MNTPFLIFVTFLLFAMQYFLYRRKRSRLEHLIDQFNGPKALPLVGNTYLALGTPRDVFRRGNALLKLGSPFRVWLLYKPMLIVYDPENMQIIAHKTLQKAHGYKFLEELLGEGLITANGEKWKRNRRLLNPTFNPQLLNKYFLKIFHEQNVKLMKVLDNEVETGRQFDLWPYILQCFLNTISMTSMNYKDDEETGLFQYGDAIVKASQHVAQRFYKPWLHTDVPFRIYEFLTGYDKLFNYVQTLPLKIIKKKKNEYLSDEKESEDGDATADEGRCVKSFMEIVLSSEYSKYFSDKELADEIITLITAGSETSSITSCFTLLMLAMNQDIQEKVYDELYTVFGDDDREADFQDLRRLVFLEQCIKETLRRFPPVPFVFRESVEDIETKDGKIIPEGTSIMMGILMMHLDKEIYPNPKEWNPDRFSVEEVKKRHIASFAGFSVGPRSCIAAKYAMLSLKTQLSSILRRYRVTTTTSMTDIKLTFDMMLRNINGYKVSLSYRKPPDYVQPNVICADREAVAA